MDNQNNNDNVRNYDPQTGAPLNSNVPPTGFETTSTPQYTEPLNMTSQTIATPKKSKLPIILGSVVGGVAVAGVAAACVIHFVPSVNNWFNLKTSEPEEYFADAEKEYFDTNASKISDQISNSTDVYSSVLGSASGVTDLANFKFPEAAGNCNVGITLNSDATIDMLNNISSISGKENIIDSSNSTNALVLDMLSSFKSVNVSSTVKSNGNGLYQTSAEFILNDASVLNADIIIDSENKSVYIAIPTVSSSYLKYTVTDEQIASLKDSMTSGSEESAAVLKEYNKAMENATAVTDKVSSNIDEILKTYSSIIIDSISDVDLKKDEKLSIAGEDFSVTEMTSKIDNKDAAEIAEKVFEEAKDDNNIIEIAEAAGMSKDDYQKKIQQALDELKDSSDEDSDSEEATLTAWTDSKGNIIGHCFAVEGTEIGYASIESDDNTYSNVWITSDDEDNPGTMSADMVANGSDKESGTITLKMDMNDTKANVTVDYKDYKVVDEKKGLVNFNATISTDYDLIKDYKMNIKSECEDDTAKVSMGLLYNDTETFGINISAGTSDDTSVSVPTSDVIDITTTDQTQLATSMMTYLQSVNIVTIKDNLKTAINNTTISAYIDQAFTAAGLDAFNGTQSAEQVASLIQMLQGSSSSESAIEDQNNINNLGGYSDNSSDSLEDYSSYFTE